MDTPQFARLVEIMDRLLAPDGCPWDREQTLDTLRPFLVEETYEVLDALARHDVAGHREELGDLMMQIVFQAALRRREGAFDVEDVARGIADKLVHRHPHVFGDQAGVSTAGTSARPSAPPNGGAVPMSSDQVLAQWDQIKAAEKAAKGEPKQRTLDGVPPGPALARAQKIGSRCGKIGFDWPGWQGSFDKVEEEVREVRDAIEHAGTRPAGPAEVHAEIGDLLLATVNLARKVGVDAEQALLDATLRFEQRFAIVEDLLAERGRTPAQSNLEEMDSLWNVAKARARERL